MTNAAEAAKVSYDFAQFLLDRDALTAEQAAEVRNRVQHQHMPIGQLLMRTAQLSVRQVMAVLAIQAETPDEKFGQIAIFLGFLTESALEDALRRQRMSHRHMIEVVHQMGLLHIDPLVETVAAYVSWLESNVFGA